MRDPFRHFGPPPSATPIPRVGRTGVTLMRTSLVTRDPAQMEEALQSYEDETPEPDYYFPQRVQWQQWKSDQTDILNGSASRPRHADADRTVPGLVEALMSGRLANHPAVPPTFALSLEDAASARMGDFADAPWDYAPVLTRDAPAYGRPVTLPGLESDEVPDLDQLPLRAPGAGRERALREIQLNQLRVRAYLMTEVRGRRR